MSRRNGGDSGPAVDTLDRPQKQHRAKAQRASRACFSCRARKVKCDVVTNSPCSNCQWDGTQCVVPRTRRTRKFLFGSQDNVDQSVTGVTYVNCQTADTQSFLDPPETNPTTDQVRDHDSTTSGVLDTSYNAVTTPTETVGRPDLTCSRAQTIPEPGSFSELPAFIRSPSVPNPGYAAFLQSQDVFDLPNVTIQCALIASFVEYIYPRMPLVDLENFLSCVGSPNGSRGKVSLVLYYAVLFAGSTHVELEDIYNHGYSDRKLLRRELYKRLLFELDIEQDRLIMAQTALLLTCRGVSDRERKDSYYWVNTAISLAYTVNLHRSSCSKNVPLNKQKHLRRLWWCCYVRDNILSLGMRKPTRIKEQDFDVPMLEVADLEFSLLTRRHTLLEHGSVGPFDQTKELESAELCVQKTRLSVLMNQILQFQAESNHPEDCAPPMPSNDPGRPGGLNALDAALKSWKKALPRSCCYRSFSGQQSEFEATATPVDVRRHLLHMAYYTALYTLHRPRFLADSPRHHLNRNLRQAQEASKVLVLDSARNITRLAAELHQHDMDCNLPIAAITVLSPAISMHLLHMKSQNQTVRDLALCNFRVCMSVMEKMQKLYPAAEVTVKSLEMTLRNASTNATTGPIQSHTSTLTILHDGSLTQAHKNYGAQTADASSENQSDQGHLDQDYDMFFRDRDDDFSPMATDVVFSQSLPNLDLDFDPSQDLDNWMAEGSREWLVDANDPVLGGTSPVGGVDFAAPFLSL
ncbi:hypothetical protein NM208_g5 [Fusarium decemcellulare]|uniref:Uncharacterized protein n=1 Tax=Fusarium decemcellulare TaxID=57161 RepID=A0ACC1T0Z6_9HYPO|nr:hypothetical protein NM208_g5 [Fusarium decemcellulare]